MTKHVPNTNHERSIMISKKEIIIIIIIGAHLRRAAVAVQSQTNHNLGPIVWCRYFEQTTVLGTSKRYDFFLLPFVCLCRKQREMKFSAENWAQNLFFRYLVVQRKRSRKENRQKKWVETQLKIFRAEVSGKRGEN